MSRVTVSLSVPFSDAAPRLLQENQKYLTQLTSLMQEAADDQNKSIVVSSLALFCGESTTRLQVTLKLKLHVTFSSGDEV